MCNLANVASNELTNWVLRITHDQVIDLVWEDLTRVVHEEVDRVTIIELLQPEEHRLLCVRYIAEVFKVLVRCDESAH